jgi:hypothetical protein
MPCCEWLFRSLLLIGPILICDASQMTGVRISRIYPHLSPFKSSVCLRYSFQPNITCYITCPVISIYVNQSTQIVCLSILHLNFFRHRIQSQLNTPSYVFLQGTINKKVALGRASAIFARIERACTSPAVLLSYPPTL